MSTAISALFMIQPSIFTKNAQRYEENGKKRQGEHVAARPVIEG